MATKEALETPCRYTIKKSVILFPILPAGLWIHNKKYFYYS